MHNKQIQRGNNNYIENINLQTFTITQHKINDYKNLNQNLSFTKYYQLNFISSLSYDTLLTNIEIKLKDNNNLFKSLFQVYSIQANSLGNRGQFIELWNINNKNKINQLNSKTILIETFTYTQTIKLSLLLCKDYHQKLQDILKLSKQKNKITIQQNIKKILLELIQNISIYGFIPNISPSATQLIQLLNISEYFKNYQRLQQAAQTDILISLSLINARRFIQASELLKNVSKYFLQRYTISSKSILEINKLQNKSIIMTDISKYDMQIKSKISMTGTVLKGGKYLYKAAKIELLLAQTINHPSLINDKLQTYNRCLNYFQGNINPTNLQLYSDAQSVMSIIGPNIIPFLIKMLHDKFEPIRISAIKSIQYIFQTLSCSIVSHIIPILKNIIDTYPEKVNYIGSKSIINKENELFYQQQGNNKNKLLIDQYNHLLETIISIIASLAHIHLHLLYENIISSSLCLQYLPYSLLLYLLRICDKIISICLADINIEITFIHRILIICNCKINQNINHFNHNILHYAQKILQNIKNKIIPVQKQSKNIIKIIQWCNKILIQLCQIDQLEQTNLFIFQQILQFIQAIFPIQNINILIKNNVIISTIIESILYFLNLSLYQLNLPFLKILQILRLLLYYDQQLKQTIPIQLINRIINKSNINNLSLKELQILLEMVIIIQNIPRYYVEEFLKCIPHSTLDQTYKVFNIMINKCITIFDQNLFKKIVQTLLDQYTVKGKAHQQSKQHLLDLIIKTNNLIHLIEICLFHNKKPNIQHYYSKRKHLSNQHNLDSKLMKIQFQMFMEKLNLFCQVMSKLEQQCEKYTTILGFLNHENINKLRNSLLQLLQSNNTKLQGKAITILKHLINITVKIKFSLSINYELMIVKMGLQLLKNYIMFDKQSKLHYNAIYNIGTILLQILNIKQYTQNKKEINKQQLQNIIKNKQFEFEIQKNITINQYINLLRLNEIIKLQPIIIKLFNSPWQSIREIIFIILIKFFILSNQYFKNYNNCNNQNNNCNVLYQQLIQMIINLIKIFIKSKDHSQRLFTIKLIGSLLGLGCYFQNKQQLHKHLQYNLMNKNIKYLIKMILQLCYDWCQDINILANISCQFYYLNKDIIKYCNENYNSYNNNNSNNKYTDNLLENINYIQQFNYYKNSFIHNNNSNNNNNSSISYIMNLEFQQQSINKIQNYYQPTLQIINQSLWKKYKQFYQILEKNSNLQFDNIAQKQSFIMQHQNYCLLNQQQIQSQKAKQQSQSQQLEFQDLGIIQVDDQDWSQQENGMKIIQKLPLKKIYKLSPSMGTSTKHQRIRRDRHREKEFQPYDQIIIDELEGSINNHLTIHSQEKKEESKMEIQPNKIEIKEEEEQQQNENQSKRAVKVKKSSKLRKSSARK